MIVRVFLILLLQNMKVLFVVVKIMVKQENLNKINIEYVYVLRDQWILSMIVISET